MKMRCQRCGKDFPKSKMSWTRDCYGIPFHHVCDDCYADQAAEDDRYYEPEEPLDDDY